MITLTIDGIQVEVPEGTTVLEAAEAAGVKIPRLCYHPSLIPYGGCRLCMVEVEGARILQPSCTLPVNNNMIVHTNTPKTQEARKFVLSMLFSERNHFCMYCQETDGDCELQAAAYDEGLTHWPLTPEYKPYAIDASHQYIFQENNRCILCRRCVRICGEKVGNFTLGFEDRGASSILVADYGVPFGESSCVSCGACVQVCPTGALMDRRSAYLGRETDLTHTVTVCTDCSLGCERDVLTRDNHLVRIEGIWDSPINEGLLCKQGRYQPLEIGYNRFTTPLIRKNGKLTPASWEEALQLAAEKLQKAPQDSKAAFVSARLPLETLTNTSELFRTGFRSTRTYLTEDNEAALCSTRLADDLDEPFEADLNALKAVDTALILGADLQTDHQVAGFFLKRQNWGGTQLINVSDQPNGMCPYCAVSLQLSPGGYLDFVDGFLLARNIHLQINQKYSEKKLATILEKTGIHADHLHKAAKLLADAEHPVIVIGGEFASMQNYEALLHLALFAQGENIPLLIIKGKANSLAAAQLHYQVLPDNKPLDAALIALGDETPSQMLIESCEGIPSLVVYASYPSTLTERADVILPATMWAEESGHYLSTDGCMQVSNPALIAPEGVRSSVEVINALADLAGLSGMKTWKEALTAEPVSVQLKM
jgi:formate dehydrogenase major subunit